MQYPTLDNVVDAVQLASGSETAWSKIMASPLMQKIMYKLERYNVIDSHDLVQEIMLELYKQVCRYVEKEENDIAVYGLLKKIADRKIADYFDQKKRREKKAKFISWYTKTKDDEELCVDKFLAVVNAEEDWEDQIIRNLDNGILHKLINSALSTAVISAGEWTIIQQYYWECKTDREIALEMDENVNTIKSRRQRAEKKLKEKLKITAA